MKTLNIIVSYTNQSAYRIISVSILAQAFGLTRDVWEAIVIVGSTDQFSASDGGHWTRCSLSAAIVSIAFLRLLTPLVCLPTKQAAAAHLRCNRRPATAVAYRSSLFAVIPPFQV